MITNDYFNHVMNRIYSNIEELNEKNKSLEERVRKLEGFKSRVIGAIGIILAIGTLLYWFKDVIFK